jgi:tetratricopeptide (TPR) repeat protein
MYRVVLAAISVVCLYGQTKQSPQDLLKEAVTFQEQGKLDQAIHDYSVFLDMYPDASQVRSNLGAALVASGNYSQAIDQYKRALASQPQPGVRLNLALAYYKSGDFREAARQLKLVRDADPQSGKAIMLLADCDLHLGDNKEVIELLTPLRSISPEDLGIAYLLGTALVRDGRVAQGQIVINQIMSKGDSAELRLLMGTTAFTARDFPHAVADLRKAVEMNPALPDAWTYYGLALLATGEMTASRNAFLKALEHDPNNFQANLNVGTQFRLDQDYEHAMPYLQRALAVRPGDLAVEFQIALVNLSLGKVDESRGQLEAIAKAAPSFTEAHVSLATVYYREKRKQDGDRERAIVQKLNAESQAKQPGAQFTDAERAK